MAVAWAETETAPIRFAAGTTALDGETQDVIYASNFAAGRTYETLLRWDEEHLASGSVGLAFDDTNQVPWRFRAYIPPHHEAVVVTAVFVLATGTATCQVTVEVGADSVVLSRSSSGTSNGSETIANTGSGVVPVVVTITRTAGIGTMRLVALMVQTTTSAATALPAAGDE